MTEPGHRMDSRTWLVREQHRPLAEIIQQQSRQHQQAPGQPDRPPSKMAHIGIQRLGAGNGKKDSAKHQKAFSVIVYEKLQPIPGKYRLQNRRILDNLYQTAQPDRGEPEQNNRAENEPTLAVP